MSVRALRWIIFFNYNGRMKKHSKKQTAIYMSAKRLFAESGWVKTSIDAICKSAGVSRVTFYKHYADKQALVMALFADEVGRTQRELEEALAQHCSLEEIISLIFQQQETSLQGLCSEAVQKDIQHTQDPVLIHFFKEIGDKKKRFMSQLFMELQSRHLIHMNFPVELIETFIGLKDVLFNNREVQNAYGGNAQQLLNDGLKLLMYGIVGKQQ